MDAIAVTNIMWFGLGLLVIVCIFKSVENARRERKDQKRKEQTHKKYYG